MTRSSEAPPRCPRAQAQWVENVARDLARCERASAEQQLEEAIGRAIGQWRLDDAIQWQRVRYRSRHLRAQIAGRGAATA